METNEHAILAPLLVGGANHLPHRIHNVLRLSVLHQEMGPFRAYKHFVELLELAVRRLLQYANSTSPPPYLAPLIVASHPCKIHACLRRGVRACGAFI